MNKGLLFSQMEPPEGSEADFHDWYETDHIPARMVIPGFESAQRYEVVDGTPRYLACYHLDDLAVLETPEYKTLKADPGERTERMLGEVLGFTRYTCEQTSEAASSALSAAAPPVLFAVAFSVPDEAADRFNSWYDEEHVPLLMEVDGWLRVRRYVVRPGFDGPPWTHLALHELRDMDVLDDPARAAARDTPRRDALAAEPWFGRGDRWVYRLIHDTNGD